MAKLVMLPVSELSAHPDNPRLALREDVVTQIAAEITRTGYREEHALLARPIDRGHQIVAGHHRHAAAIRAGAAEIPVWVRDMGDEEAFMQLVLSNTQGELAPLEIGMHALTAVPLAQGKAGAGLTAYAAEIGKTPQYVGQLRSAAEVVRELRNLSFKVSVEDLLENAKHLHEISKADEAAWPLLVGALLASRGKDGKNGWSVKDAAKKVGEVAALVTPEDHNAWLPRAAVVESYLTTDQPNAAALKRLVLAADGVLDAITRSGNAQDEADFRAWLAEEGRAAWDHKAISGYHAKLITAWAERSESEAPQAELGQWWRLGKHLMFCGDSTSPEFRERATGALVFADPPYNAGKADWDHGFMWDHDWLTDAAPVVAVTPGISAIADFYRVTQMPYKWSIAAWIDNGMTRGALGFGNWIYVGLFSKQDSIYRNSQDHLKVSIGASPATEHPSPKPAELLMELLGLLTEHGDTVIDPFLGSGATLFAAEQSGRVCIGAEIEPAYCTEILARFGGDVELLP
jgi:ParB-like chromosome segregation protein Spo0J